MASQIFNRTEFQHPDDGWYMIEAKGEHPNAAAGVVQVIDDQAAQAIVNRFNDDADAGELRHVNEMLIDHEHFSDQPDQETRAYGWLTKLQNRADGIYGQIRWTNTGKASVDGGDYRFFSTEYDPADLQVLSGQNPKRVRPLRLDGLTLTNMNNNRGQRPITNRENYGSHGTKEAWEGARAENLRHVEANKAAAREADDRRKADTEGEAAELAQPALEKFCRAVQKVMEATSKAGHSMMTLREAWTYAQAKFPELYAAAFALAGADDEALAGKQVPALANRIGALAGKNFDFGWQFVREELPQIFNRMTPAPARIQNRVWHTDRHFAAQKSAKLLNRLVRAESAITGLPEAQALKAIKTRHPGLYALAGGTAIHSEALQMEPGIWNLLSEK